VHTVGQPSLHRVLRTEQWDLLGFTGGLLGTIQWSNVVLYFSTLVGDVAGVCSWCIKHPLILARVHSSPSLPIDQV
jgi:hypothetical protein